MLLTTTQFSKLCKDFAKGSSAKIKLSKTQFHKIGQSGEFLGTLLGPLLKTELLLLGNALKLLAKSVLIPLGLKPAASPVDAAFHKKMLGSGVTTLIILNEEMNDIMKIVKSLEKSGLLKKGVSKTTKNEVKEQKGGFLGMLLGTFGASSLGNLLTGKGIIRVGEGTFRSGDGTVRAGQDF